MDQFRQKAAATFHQPPESLNCAQSVAAIAGRNDVVPEYKAFGGGRAEGGYCGALYAALQLSPESARESIRQAFLEGTGALTCKEIKSGSKTSCQECVALGAYLIEQYRNQ